MYKQSKRFFITSDNFKTSYSHSKEDMQKNGVQNRQGSVFAKHTFYTAYLSHNSFYHKSTIMSRGHAWKFAVLCTLFTIKGDFFHSCYVKKDIMKNVYESGGQCSVHTGHCCSRGMLSSCKSIPLYILS